MTQLYLPLDLCSCGAPAELKKFGGARSLPPMCGPCRHTRKTLQSREAERRRAALRKKWREQKRRKVIAAFAEQTK